jgi:heme exporter protein A
VTQGETPALAVEGLTRIFGPRKALDAVEFELPSGAFLSIFGPNGAGKTTLLRTLTTLQNPSSGSAKVLGLDVVADAVELRSRIGFISHNSLLYPDLSAEENLLFFAEMYGIQDPAARVAELLDSVELLHRRFDLVRTFSRGMLQRLSIARALLHRPE